jgi:peroxiredoxin
MRQLALFCLCFLLSLDSALGQESIVRITSLLLTREKAGWRVDFPGDAAYKYSLQNGDLLTTIDGEHAELMGPLAVTAVFNAAFNRTVRITVDRDTRKVEINLWRGDGPAPAANHETLETFVSTTEEAPDFALPTLNDVPIRLSSQRGKWVLISFWATWCVPCEQESEILSRLAKTYPENLRVLALAVQDSREKLKAFSEKLHPAYTILEAGPLTGQLALAYGVGSLSGGGSVPVNVLVRPDGNIAYVQAGYEAPSPLEKQVNDIISPK